jgi:hypothetical protein
MSTPSDTPPHSRRWASRGVVLVCASCPTVWEPTDVEWATGRTACPECGGWVMTAVLEEPGPSTLPRP